MSLTAGLEIYQVGGAVRDRLLGLPVTERDWVVVGSSPEEMLARGFQPVGKDFPVFLHPETHEEYALARTEQKVAPGYHGFIFHADTSVTLEQDLQRRDLTINAIAENAQGQLIDPCGGQADLRAKTLRHVSPAFREDPVRILRLARFAARFANQGFGIAEETLTLCQQMVHAHEADALVPERVWQEMAKALTTSRPDIFVEVLGDSHLLRVILPELSQTDGTEQAALEALRQAATMADDLTVRFAVLLHALGDDCVLNVCERLRTPRAYRDLAVLVARHHKVFAQLDSLKPEGVIDLLMALDAYRRPARVADFICACEAIHPEQRQGNYLRHALQITQAIDAQVFIRSGLRGAEIAQAVHTERIRCLQQRDNR